jgi:hypothetical protein
MAAPVAQASARLPLGSVLTVRLACLVAAAIFLAPRGEAKSPDVLTVAERFATWVTRAA